MDSNAKFNQIFSSKVVYPKILACNGLMAMHHSAAYLSAAYLCDLFFNLSSLSLFRFVIALFSLRLWMGLSVSLILYVVYSSLIFYVISGEQVNKESSALYLRSKLIGPLHKLLLLASDQLTNYTLLAFFGPEVPISVLFPLLWILLLNSIRQIYLTGNNNLFSWDDKSISRCYRRINRSYCTESSLLVEFLDSLPTSFRLFLATFIVGLLSWGIVLLVDHASLWVCLSNLLAVMHPSLLLLLILCFLRSQFMLFSTENIIASVLRKNVEFALPPAQQSLIEPSQIYLPIALNSDNKLIKYSAFSDLSYLSNENKSRRMQIFSVSLPGGHPRNWNSILKSCVQVLDSLDRRLEGSLSSWKKHNSVESMKESHRTALIPPHLQTCNFASSGPILKTTSLNDFLKSTILKFKFSPCLVDEVFADSQLIVFALDSLSHLVYHSYGEDTNGVVQEDIPNIIQLLLKLNTHMESVSRVFAWNIANNYNGALSSKVCVEQALNTAISRIGLRFKSHVHNLKLDSPTRKMLFNLWN